MLAGAAAAVVAVGVLVGPTADLGALGSVDRARAAAAGPAGLLRRHPPHRCVLVPVDRQPGRAAEAELRSDAVRRLRAPERHLLAADGPPGAVAARERVGRRLPARRPEHREPVVARWLAANAPSYGFFNLPSEPWHWTVNGD